MSRQLSCLSELRFAALLVYSPDGQSAMSIESRMVVRAIKDGRQDYIERLGLRARESFAGEALRDFFGRDVTLVPVPRSVPFRSKDALWPAMRICRALESQGLCRDVQPLLVRSQPVPKSALRRSANERPSPLVHAETMTVPDALAASCQRVCLVDDVVTRGATLLGAASRLRHVLPATQVVAFAAVRTMSHQEIAAILEPAEGRIRFELDRVWREP